MDTLNTQVEGELNKESAFKGRRDVQLMGTKSESEWGVDLITAELKFTTMLTC